MTPHATTCRPPFDFSTAGLRAAALGLLFAGGQAGAVTASTLPAALYEVSIGGTTTDYDVPGDYSAGSAHVVTSNLPSASTSASIATSGLDDARGWMRYAWRLDGPSGVMVPITITYDLRASSSAPDDGQANAGATMTVAGGALYHSVSIEIDRGGFNSTAPTRAHSSFSDLVATGTDGAVTLQSFVNGRASIHGGASGFAFADPVFSIDPSFAAVDPDYASHYGFSFSPGVGNDLPTVAAVPEPETYALLTAGLGVVGAAVRRRAR